jgi:hypothetical protein
VYEPIGFFEVLSMVDGKKEKKKEHVGSSDRVHVTEPPNPVDESYYPAVRAAGGPFPVGKRKERKKTETFSRGESGQTDL